MLQINTDSITHKFTEQSYRWIITFAPKLLIAVLIFFAGQWVIKLLNKGLKRILHSNRFDATLRPFIQNLLSIVLQVLLILGIMQILGIQMTLFAAVIGAFGVAIGLALSGTLQNFAGGVLIILLKPFSVGENIRTQGEEGTVTAIRLFYTVIRTFTNTTLIVPNNKLSNEVILNLTREKKRRMDTSIKLPYHVDFRQVEDIIMQTIASFTDKLEEPKARVGVESIDSDGYTVTINMWTNAHGFQDAKLAFNQRLLEDLKDIFLQKAPA